MSQQTKNSCAKVFGNRLRNKNLRPKNRGGGGQIYPPPPLMPSRLKRAVRQCALILATEPGNVPVMFVLILKRVGSCSGIHHVCERVFHFQKDPEIL